MSNVIPSSRQFNSVIDLMIKNSTEYPDKMAFEIDGRSLTYREFHDRVDTCASLLLSLGVKRDDRVATMLFNCVEQTIIWFAAIRIGAIWVPFNVGLMRDDLHHVLSDSKPTVLLIDPDNHEKFQDFSSEDLPEFRFITGSSDFSRFRSFDFLNNDSKSNLNNYSASRSSPSVIIYTGGTTGMPKGVVLPNYAFVAAGERYAQAFEVRSSDVHFSVLSLFHVGGSMIGFLGPFYCQIPTYIERWFSVTRFWKRAIETNATVIDPIGTMVTLLTQSESSEGDGQTLVRSSLGVFGQISDNVREQYIKRFNLKIVGVYSLTEAGGTLIVHNKMDSSKPLASGLPFGWCEIKIADDLGDPIPAGKVGNILLRPTVPDTFMIEYYNAPAKTLECTRNLWLHTGDFGYVDDDGYLYFAGRQAHWIRCRGENVSAYEVESILSQHDLVQESAVVGVSSDIGEEDIKAFVILKEGAFVSPEELIDWCAERLAKFKIPRYIVYCDDFPRSAAKREIERHKLKERFFENVFDYRSKSSVQ